MSTVRLVLPYPVSANVYWRTFLPRGHKRAVTVLSEEAKAYKAEVRRIATLAGVGAPIAGRVAVSYVLFPKRPKDWQKRARNDAHWDDDVQCIDLDNANKVLMDSLKNVAFHDDKWVRRIYAERAEPDGEARLEVVIESLESEPVQPGLL
jgi:crossover junction endodeoxyribonuclease RusA